MQKNKTAAPVLQHQDGKERRQNDDGRVATTMVYSPARGVKSFFLACGAVAAALGSLWWLCAVCAGTAGGMTGPLVLAGVCAWLAKLLADAAGRGYIDGRPQRKN